MIKVGCKGCQKTVGVPVKYAGKLIKCPNCSEPVRIPKAVADQKPASAAPARSPLDDPYQDNSNTAYRDNRADDSDVDLLSGPMVDPLAPESADRWAPGHAAAPLSNSLNSKPRTPSHSRPTKSKTVASRSAKNSSDQGVSIGRSFAGLTVAAIVAGFCTVAWVLLAFFSGYELGILAWGTGGLIGLVAGAIAKNASPIYCGLTAVVALTSFFGAKIIMALAVMAAFFALDMAQNFQFMDNTTRKFHSAAAFVMIEEGEFDAEEMTLAKENVEGYFNGESGMGLDNFLQSGVEAEGADVQARIDEKIKSKLEPLTLDQKLVMLDKARQSNPQWVEHEYYVIPLVDAMLKGDEIEDEALAKHAKTQVANWNLEDEEVTEEEEESYANFDYEDYSSRNTELRKLAGTKLATIPFDQRDQMVRDYLADHLNWTAFNDSFQAQAKKMQAQGQFSGDVKEFADAELNGVFGQADSTYFDDIPDQRYSRLDKQYRELVNAQLVEMDVAQREQLVKSTKEANADWYTVGEFDTVSSGIEGAGLGEEEIDEFKADLGSDGSFVSSYRSVASWLDFLWVLLSTTTAYSVAAKHGSDD